MSEYQYSPDRPLIADEHPEDPAPRLTRRKPIALLSIGLLIGTLVMINTAMSRSPNPDAKGTLPQSRLLTVSSLFAQPADSWTVQRKYTGTIVARRKSPLGFELAGKLLELLVDEGDSVRTGDPLARLDTEQLQTRRQELVARRNQSQAVLAELVAGPRQEVIDASRSAVNALAAQVELLTLELARHKHLVNTRAVSVSDYDTVRFNLQSRQAELKQTKHRLQELLNGTRQEKVDAQRSQVEQLAASIQQVDVQLAKSTMFAPFDGTISRRHVDEGTVVDAGEPVLRIVEVQFLEAWIGMPVHAVETLQPGQPYQIQVDRSAYSATIQNLFPEIDPATQTRTVVFKLPTEAAEKLVDGQVVRAAVDETIHESGFWLPLTALQKDARGLWTCFVLEPAADDQWQVKRRYLELLHTDQNRAFVRGTLYDGDRVVADGGHRIVVGQMVLASDRDY